MCKKDGITSPLMNMLRAEADRLIAIEHPLAKEVAEDHGRELSWCAGQLWFRTSLADKLRSIEARKRNPKPEED